MKLKLSPFTILFVVLNSLLIFCATSSVDSGKERSTSSTDTKMETEAKSDSNFDFNAKISSKKNTSTIGKPSYSIDYATIDKSAEDPKVVSVKDDYTEGSVELKPNIFILP